MLNNSLKILLFIPVFAFSQEVNLNFDKNNNKLIVTEDLRISGIFDFSYGKKKGKKTRYKDLKTPEGKYSIVRTYSRSFMKKNFPKYKRYGSFAFVLNYPNEEDKKNGYTGSGIWIHGTDYEYRLLYKNITKGCLLLYNHDIKKLHTLIKGKNISVNIY